MKKEASNPRERIGILGGTFDPIHNGHIYIGEEAVRQLALDKVIYIPTGVPPHKTQKKITDSRHRLIMTYLATNDHEKFFVSPDEVDRNGTSYTVDTLKLLKEKYLDAALYFIIGEDAFCDVPTWKDYEIVLRNINFIVFKREKSHNTHINLLIDLYKSKYLTDIKLINIDPIDISATEIREKLEENQCIKSMVNNHVYKYIKKYKLYV